MNEAAPLLVELPRWAFALALVLARVGACVMLLPGLGEAAMPALPRAGLVLALVLLLLPGLIDAMPPQPDHPLTLATQVLAELLTGAVLGWLARLAVLAVPMAGAFMAHMAGLSNVLQPDAELGAQASALERLLGLAAATLVLSAGLYSLPLAALAGSYRLVPPGGTGLAADAPAAILAALAEATALALQLAAPFVLAGTMFQIALGLLGRLVPRLQIYFIAMPGQILGGLLLLGLLADIILGIWSERLRDDFSRLPGLG